MRGERMRRSHRPAGALQTSSAVPRTGTAGRGARRFSLACSALLALAGTAGCRAGDDAPSASDTARNAATQTELGQPVSRAGSQVLDYTPPPDSAIPDDSLGASIRRGQAIFVRS